MNYRLILDALEWWQTDEVFFRDYYNAVREGRSTDELLKRPEVRQSDKDFALDPTQQDILMTEKRFFEEGRNVFLIKHPRYCPYFEHRHAFFEAVYVLKGHCVSHTDGRDIEMKAGDLCVLAPNITHGIRVFDDSLVINLLIRHSTFEDIFLHAIRDKSQISLFFLGNLYEKQTVRYLLYHTDGDTALRNFILDMYAEQTTEDEFSDRIMCSYLTIFLSQLNRSHGDDVEIPDMSGRRNAYSDEIMRYIMDNYETVTLNGLAEHFHFAVPYCSKLVKTISGSAFSGLVTRIRLQKGENYLSHTQMSIAGISERIGYRNPETFIRAFSRVYRMTPSQYRKSKLVPQA